MTHSHVRSCELSCTWHCEVWTCRDCKPSTPTHPHPPTHTPTPPHPPTHTQKHVSNGQVIRCDKLFDHERLFQKLESFGLGSLLSASSHYWPVALWIRSMLLCWSPSIMESERCFDSRDAWSWMGQVFILIHGLTSRSPGQTILVWQNTARFEDIRQQYDEVRQQNVVSWLRQSFQICCIERSVTSLSCIQLKEILGRKLATASLLILDYIVCKAIICTVAPFLFMEECHWGTD